jgi:hypothetical protein
MMILIRTLSALLSLAAASLLFSQPHWSAPLAPVAQDGYYTIVLSPEVIGRSRADLGDLRLLDQAGREVAYVLEHEPAVYDRTWIRSYALLRNERVGRWTLVEMEADSAALVDEIQVRVRNARVGKRARVTGSDDRKNWYLIKDEDWSVGGSGDSISVIRFVQLPLSNYHYYRIALDDSLSPPVQVLDISYAGRSRTEGQYTPIENVRSSREEDHRETRIALSCPHPFRADRVVFDVRSDEPFLRNGRFYRKVDYTVRHQRRDLVRSRPEYMEDFTLTRASLGALPGTRIPVDTLWCVIQNGNDLPLVFDDIRVFQLEERLVAKLKAGEHYTVTTADAKASIPRYDIALFRDSLPASLGVLSIPAMVSTPMAAKEADPTGPDMKWVWAAIIGLGAVITFSTLRLLRKSGENQNA